MATLEPRHYTLASSKGVMTEASDGAGQRIKRSVAAFLGSFLFVVVTLLLWYVFNLATRVVITCLPGDDSCILRHFDWLQLHSSPYLYGSRYVDAFVTLATLVAAFSVAIRTFYPPDDFDRPAPNH
jgi:hypothetical protein